MTVPNARRLGLILLVAAAYFIAARAGLGLAFVHVSATAVWPPTGIALAALLIFGRGVWPGVFAGAFLANLSTLPTASNESLVTASLWIATGNTLEVVVGELLVRRWAGGRTGLYRAADMFKFVGLAGALAPTIGATFGVVSLAMHGLLGAAELHQVWVTWWLGDGVGAVVFAPLILFWAEPQPIRWTIARVAEAAALLASAVVTAQVVFGGWLGQAPPLAFMTIPIFLWSAFRFTGRETTTVTVVLSLLAIRGTLKGYGQFAGGVQNEPLLLLQAFTGVIAVAGLVVCALRRGERELQAGLERRVVDRTRALRMANESLQEEVARREAAETELRASEAGLREAQSIAHVGSWEWNIVTDEVRWSDELCRIYGVDAGARPTYETFLEHVHPDDRETARGTVQQALTDAQPFAFEHRITRPDGDVRTLLARGRVVTAHDGRPVGMVGTGQDITDRKRAEEAQVALVREQAARRQAEDANRMKDQFLAVVSHELRTPLNAVLGWAQLLLKGLVDAATVDRALRAIERNAKVQIRIIEDLLDVSEFRIGRLRLEAQRLELGAIVSAAIDSVNVAAEAKNIGIDVRLETPTFIKGDPERLQQVVWNLLSNAVKFTPEGGRVDVDMQRANGHVVVRVSDTGRGLDQAAVNRAFEAFWQETPERQPGGLGLGLAIVRTLTEAHGGTVHVSSGGPGHGACFTVSLPLAQ